MNERKLKTVSNLISFSPLSLYDDGTTSKTPNPSFQRSLIKLWNIFLLLLHHSTHVNNKQSNREQRHPLCWCLQWTKLGTSYPLSDSLLGQCFVAVRCDKWKWYRVFIKYCVFSENFKIFQTLAFLCYPSVSVCVHT